jgi:anaerobic ribonucleoside-triphosphate reductase
LQFEHHPIRKLLDEFRKWLEEYIREKHLAIKQAINFFNKEDP